MDETTWQAMVMHSLAAQSSYFTETLLDMVGNRFYEPGGKVFCTTRFTCRVCTVQSNLRCYRQLSYT